MLVLAPPLTALVLVELSEERACELDMLPDATGQRASAIALVMQRLSIEDLLDERIAAIAGELATLAEGNLSQDEFDILPPYLRGLLIQEFVAFVAQVFTEAFADAEVWRVDAPSVASTARQLAQRLQEAREDE